MPIGTLLKKSSPYRWGDTDVLFLILADVAGWSIIMIAVAATVFVLLG